MIEAISKRRSIRKYLNTEVEDEKIKCIIESAMLAPSGNNTQPWHFIVVKSEETKRIIAEISHNQLWMTEAPVFLVCAGDIRSRIKKGDIVLLDEMCPLVELKKVIRDTAIAAEHAVLEACNQGLGTCWVAWFEQDLIRYALGIPHDKYVLCVITIGYPAEEPGPRHRKNMKDIIHYEKW